jgi:hypothetical protein
MKFVYFIGGPWDLIKRVMRESDIHSTIFVAEIPDVRIHEDTIEDIQNITCFKHAYTTRPVSQDAFVAVWDRKL